jgi:ParB-like chromosome segregation protein Spo0J
MIRVEHTPPVGVKWHPYSELFPWIEGSAFQELKEDIRKNGVLEPIVFIGDAILDGRNRYVAARELGIEYPRVEYEGDDPLGFVLSKNLARRHLTESQRGMVAARLAKLPAHRPAEDNSANLRTSDAAEMLNVSPRTVETARKVVNDGAPELVAAVESGSVSVSAAADVATLPKEEQVEIVAKGEAEIVRTANRIKRERKEQRQAERRQEVAELAALVSTATSQYDLYNEPCINAMKGDAGSIDWIITDPPYPKEFLHVYDDLAQVADHVLKPGGSLLCMVGQSYLPDIIAALANRLTYHWTIAYLTPGGQATQLFPRRINTFWKPVLWFVKGDYAGDWIGDVTRSDANDNDKRFHHWGQSESGMADLMRRFVKPGDRVLDPFMGAGTTGAIALDLGAYFVGFDPDENSFNEATVRLDRAKLVA